MSSLDERITRVASAFAATYGHDPEVIWFAPGRVNLIGDHTDYNLGFSMPFAVHFGVICAAARRDDGHVRIASQQVEGVGDVDMSEVTPGRMDVWYSYVVGTLYGLRAHGVTLGLDLLVDGDVPPGAGMSSSAALCCVTALVADDLAGAGLDRETLALVAQSAEHHFAGTPCGLLDQTASLQARADHVLRVDFRSMHVDHHPIALAEQGLALLVIDTRAPHRLVDSEYAQRRGACESAAADLGVASLREITDPSAAAGLDEVRAKRVRHVVTENQRVEDVARRLDAGQLDQIGPLLTASHISLRDDYEVTVPELDVAVEAALAAGALGARMTGGGFGGSVVALVRALDVAHVEQGVREAYAARGFTAPQIHRVAPSPGAHRLVP